MKTKVGIVGIALVLLLTLVVEAGASYASQVPQAGQAGSKLNQPQLATTAQVQAIKIAAIAALGSNAQEMGHTVLVDGVLVLDNWAFGGLIIRAGDKDEAPDVKLLLAQEQKGQWQVALEYSAQYDQWLYSVPDTLVGASLKKIGQRNPSPMGNGAAQLSLPWATGESAGFGGGPHGWDGYSEPRSSLDFSPNSGNDRAARDGVAYTYSTCPNFIEIVHAGGWTTTYYHVTNIAVYNGQPVSRGQYLGQISAQVGCGGSASGPHLHFTLKYNGGFTAVNGHDIGGWTVSQGANYYQGCMSKNGNTQCAPNGSIYNDGTIGGGGGGDTCPGAGCTGQDPVTAGCSSDAYTARSASGSVNGKNYTVELRWSPRCQSNWAKLTVNGASTLEVQLERTNGSAIAGTYYNIGGSTYTYGNMYYAPTESVMACGKVDGYGWFCTAAGL